jgi:alpha-galactosidase/6-phospho-beta-glucosidase family protein
LGRIAAPTTSAVATEWLERHAAFETKTAEALAGSRSPADVRERRDELIVALASNPMVPSIEMASSLVDEILDRSPS